MLESDTKAFNLLTFTKHNGSRHPDAIHVKQFSALLCLDQKSAVL